MSEIYDLIILGGGPAGYCAAERAGAAGMKVRLIEKRALGGVCLNEGCIPSKTLLNSAKALHYAQDSAAFGVTAKDARADAAFIVSRKNDVVKKLVAGVGMKMKKHGVEVTNADGTINGRGSAGFSLSAGGETFFAKRLLLATGSEAFVPNIPGVAAGRETGFVWTSREALDATAIPARLVVVGGGVIGLEMATYFQAMGAKVTVIEMMGAIGGPLDADAANALKKNLKAIDFKLNAKVTKIGTNGVTFETNGKEETVAADQVLLSIGRRPVTQGFGLENLKIELMRGAVPADESGLTAMPDLYAAGDVNGRSMLAHTAYREAECAVAAMMGKPEKVDYNAIPSVIYTSPEVACVGLTEAQAKERGYQYKALRLPMAYSGRYLAETAGDESFLKLIVDDKSRRVLGVHVVSPYASEMIYGAAMMVSTQMPVEALRRVVFPHPTVGEVLREALWEI